jgi:putative addiction module component (TIGR02574 family)
MSVTLESLGIDRMSIKDRIELIDLIWESIPDTFDPEELTEEHIELLTERLAEAEANPGVGTPWREVMASLRARS